MLALQAARVFDGEKLVEQPVVLLDGQSIVDVGVAPPPDAELVDLGDATLLPGLIDTHQHLVFSGQGELEEQVAPFSDEELFARARANAAKALRAGVTTIRDLGDRNFLTLPLREDPSLPTLLCAGPPITVPNGHCWYLNGECEPGDVAKAVGERAERGCDVVKVMVSGGHGTPTYPMYESQFTTDDMRALVDAAHQRGLPVAAHCHGFDAIVSAVEVGVDTIEHCTFFTKDMRSEVDDALLDQMARKGIAVSGTFGMLPGHEPPPIIKANIGVVVEKLGEFRRNGGVLVAGTDAGISPAKPHDVLPHALAYFDNMAAPRAEALRAMTADAAQVVRLGDRKGRLRAGFDADLLAVAGNPLADGDLLTPVGVWRAGQRVG
jgi:imidazolonepropionase-like amidohydrolase